jgi:hypothetical protein
LKRYLYDLHRFVSMTNQGGAAYETTSPSGIRGPA